MIEIVTITIGIETGIGMWIGRGIDEIEEIGIEIEIGVDQFMIRRIVRRMKIIVLIATEVVNVYDYQGVILSQPHKLYQEQYFIGK